MPVCDDKRGGVSITQDGDGFRVAIVWGDGSRHMSPIRFTSYEHAVGEVQKMRQSFADNLSIDVPVLSMN